MTRYIIVGHDVNHVGNWKDIAYTDLLSFGIRVAEENGLCLMDRKTGLLWYGGTWKHPEKVWHSIMDTYGLGVIVHGTGNGYA